MINCSLPIFTSKETITNPMQYDLSQEESALLKAALYFFIQSKKIWKSEIFTTFEKIHRLFINNHRSEETKTHHLYLANSYLYNYKPSLCILRHHHVLLNLRKNKDIVIKKPDKGNEVVTLDRELYNSAILEIVSDTSKFQNLIENATFKREASLQHLLRKLKQKICFTKNESDQCYPSGSAPARIYGSSEMHKCFSSDTFPKRLISRYF